jgi:hypothetical protein
MGYRGHENLLERRKNPRQKPGAQSSEEINAGRSVGRASAARPGRPAARPDRAVAAADPASAARRRLAVGWACPDRLAAGPASVGRPVADPAFDRCPDSAEYFRSD